MEKNNDAADSSRLIICQKCEKYFDQNLNGDNFYQYCAECRRSIDNSIGDNEPELNVMPIDRKHKCTICGKIYRFPSHLATHMRSHTGEKPYECEFCDKSFTQLCTLKTHLRTHTGERPFKCDYCEKTFRVNCTLDSHERIHTGLKPYECGICLRQFTQANVLKRHLKIHAKGKRCNKIFRDKTVKKLLKCQFCDKMFTEVDDLMQHQITHNGDKLLCVTASSGCENISSQSVWSDDNASYCKICEMRFTTGNELENHACGLAKKR